MNRISEWGIWFEGRAWDGSGNCTEVVAFHRSIKFGQRNTRQQFGTQGFGGRRPDRGRVLFRRRSAANQPPAGDGRCPGRSPASCCVEAFARSASRPHGVAARRTPRPAGAGCGGAVSQRWWFARGPQPLCRRGGALQGRSPAGVGQISRTAVEHAEDRHGSQQGGPGRQERHDPEAGDSEHRRRDARNRRGRQRFRRPVFHPRFRCPQRHLPRRRARCRRQRSREFLHRTGRNPARTGLVLCRPRHHRRRDQYRHQAGDP